jgi:hypothetical protein
MLTDGHKGMTKVIGSFCDYANAPKNVDFSRNIMYDWLTNFSKILEPSQHSRRQNGDIKKVP